jgi:hypothetical protein
MLKTGFIEPSLNNNLQVGKHALSADALKQGACQLKQRKIDKRQKLCFSGLGVAM